MVGPRCGTCRTPINSDRDVSHKFGRNYTITYCKKCGAVFDFAVNTRLKED